MKDLSVLNAIRGCLLGGAAGDALGYTVEFRQEEDIFGEYGPEGITAYDTDPFTGMAEISDDTQMTLFTADGILRAEAAGADVPRAYVMKAYKDWLLTQTESMRSVTRSGKDCSWLLRVPDLYSRRAPGNTCLSALMDGTEYDDYVAAARNNSKGCGGVMRVAPLGAYRRAESMEALDMEGAQLAAITHGHSLGYMPAAVLVHVINRIIYQPENGPMALRDIILEARDTAAEVFAGDPYLDELTGIIDRAVMLAESGADSDLENIHELGQGWVGEEALAISLYCALRHQYDFSAGIIAAVNHRGDSDSTGAVTGNILGALHGYDAIAGRWEPDLELRDVILETAEKLWRL